MMLCSTVRVCRIQSSALRARRQQLTTRRSAHTLEPQATCAREAELPPLDAYQKRDQGGLISFHGQEATVLLPLTSSVERAKQCRADMRTGGRTSLVAGLVTAYEVLMRHRQRERQTQPLQGLLTDGRANISFGTGDPVGEAFQQAWRPRAAGVSTLSVETEQGTMQLGLAQRVAAAAGGTCLHLADLAANTLATAVRLSLSGWR
jgi:magnesium chelatase subunit D